MQEALQLLVTVLQRLPALPYPPLLLDWAHISDEEIIKSASSAANVVGVVAGGRGNGCKGNTGRITMPTRT